MYIQGLSGKNDVAKRGKHFEAMQSAASDMLRSPEVGERLGPKADILAGLVEAAEPVGKRGRTVVMPEEYDPNKPQVLMALPEEGRRKYNVPVNFLGPDVQITGRQNGINCSGATHFTHTLQRDDIEGYFRLPILAVLEADRQSAQQYEGSAIMSHEIEHWHQELMRYGGIFNPAANAADVASSPYELTSMESRAYAVMRALYPDQDQVHMYGNSLLRAYREEQPANKDDMVRVTEDIRRSVLSSKSTQRAAEEACFTSSVPYALDHAYGEQTGFITDEQVYAYRSHGFFWESGDVWL